MPTLSSVPEERAITMFAGVDVKKLTSQDRQAINNYINQQIKSVLDSIPEPTITDVFPSKPYDGTKTYEDMLQVVEYYKSTIQKIRSRYE